MEEKEKKESNLLNNIKNKYILKNLFEYLTHEKLLNVIKYNKDIQNKLNINIDTYKDLQIVIDIIPKKKNMVHLLILVMIINLIIIFILMIIKKK